ncbi:MAG: hypothetical protein ABIR94_08030 [Rubrivivax sp.]
MTRSPSSRRLVAALALAGTAGLTCAETSPYYIGATQAFSYDSNVFRQVDALAQASSWGSTGVVAGFDQPYGRQRFYGSANVQYNYYQQLSQLNNTSYAADVGWDWATIERLSGTVLASISQNLGNYGGLDETGPINIKNIQTGGRAFATVNYGLISLLQFHGRLGYSRVNYSARQYERYELEQSTATLGVRKQFGGRLTLGTGLTYTQGDYFSIGREFDRYDIFVSGAWDYSGLSRFSARLNYTDINYTGLFAQDQSGLTGFVRWAYKATGKLDFTALLSYDTLANSGLTDTSGGLPVSLGDTNRLTTALRLTAGYAATSKIKVDASLNHYRRSNEDLDSNNLIIDTRDQVTSATLGATWTPTRNWLVACNVNLQDRNQSGSDPGRLRPYTSYGASCSAQFALQ